MTTEIANQTTPAQPAPTSIAQSLAAPGHRLVEYRGALTVAAFADEATETVAALESAALHDLGWQQRVAVTGEDRMRWLNGMVTNNVAGLSANAPDSPLSGVGNYNLILNAQGRIQGDCRVWSMSSDNPDQNHNQFHDQLELELAANQFPRLIAHLERFIIMDDVELTPFAGWTALALTGPKAAAVLQAAGLNSHDPAAIPPGASLAGHLRAPATAREIPVLLRRDTGRLANHLALWCRNEHAPDAWLALQAAGATAIGAKTVERLRIVEGSPAFGIDFADDTLPQEAGIDEALHFTKGCYLGQEIVERIHSRGQVHRHVRAIEIFPAQHEPTVGMELSAADQKPIGKLTSLTRVQLDGAPRWFALAVIRTEAETSASPWTYPGGKAQLRTRTPKTTTPEPNEI